MPSPIAHDDILNFEEKLVNLGRNIGGINEITM